MNKTPRIVALLLSAVVMLSSLQLTVFAKENETQIQEDMSVEEDTAWEGVLEDTELSQAEAADAAEESTSADSSVEAEQIGKPDEGNDNEEYSEVKFGSEVGDTEPEDEKTGDVSGVNAIKESEQDEDQRDTITDETETTENIYESVQNAAPSGYFTVTYDANGGYFTDDSIWDDEKKQYVNGGTKVVEYVKPGDQSYLTYLNARKDSPHMMRTGWSLTPDGSSPVAAWYDDYYPSKDCTVYAIYTEYYTVTFDATGGTFEIEKEDTEDLEGRYVQNVGKVTKFTLKSDEMVNAPSNPENNSPEKKFDGWSTTPNGTPVSSIDLSINSDCTIYAIWADAYTVTMNANGGYYDNLFYGKLTEIKEKVLVGDFLYLVDTNSSMVDQLKPGKKGQIFAGYSLTKNGAPISNYKHFAPTKSCTVYVVWKTPVQSITLSKKSLTLQKGKTATIKVKTVTPSYASNKAVTWKSSNTKVATVSSSGKITAKGKGTANITATAKDGSKVKAVCKVTVTQPVTKLTISKTKATVKTGKTITLKVTAAPKTANNKAVKWTTSNKKIATVTQKGVVKGIKKGTVTITATAKDGSGKKVSCKITVK